MQPRRDPGDGPIESPDIRDPASQIQSKGAMIDLSTYPALQSLVAHQLEVWPEHAPSLARSFESRSPATLAIGEEAAEMIMRLAASAAADEGLHRVCRDYRYLCEELILPEELHFRRNGRYRLNSFEDANRECYANAGMMARYMDGLLLSTVFWNNHAGAFTDYVNRYLPTLPVTARHLEIGPGHGLQLSFAASRLPSGEISGWDISPTSVARTRMALDQLNEGRTIAIEVRDLFAPKSAEDLNAFDSIVLSEVLEHLEDPAKALLHIKELLKPGGLIWVNVPINSPAPDHIFLLRTPEEARQLVSDAGFEVVASDNFPMSNFSLASARKHRLCVSCVVTGRRVA